MGSILLRLLLVLLLVAWERQAMPQASRLRVYAKNLKLSAPPIQNSSQKVPPPPVIPKQNNAPTLNPAATPTQSHMGKPTELQKQTDSDDNEEKDPEQAETESDSVVPKTPQNPFSKPDIDRLIKKQFDDDMWRIMKGALPCLETSAVCLQQLQEKAVLFSPLLKEIGLTQKRSPNPLKKGAFKFPPFLRGASSDLGFGLSVRKSWEIDSRVTEANQKIDEAKARNQKTSPKINYAFVEIRGLGRGKPSLVST